MSRRSGGTDERDSSRHASRDPSNDPLRDPWRAFVTVAQIPDTGLHRDIEADVAVRKAMADIAGVREISSARASFDLTPDRRGRIHVVGSVHAQIGQTCVVTLDPIDNEIDETVDLMFVPEEQIPQHTGLADEALVSEADIADAPEPIVDGMIDLGRLATDVLFLAIDPYPRKPGAMFELEVAPADPEDHPFAALKALQLEPKSADAKKSRDKG
jgi:uncharacterized metal-binding protein YceD (DUF177 family)